MTTSRGSEAHTFLRITSAKTHSTDRRTKLINEQLANKTGVILFLKFLSMIDRPNGPNRLYNGCPLVYVIYHDSREKALQTDGHTDRQSEVQSRFSTNLTLMRISMAQNSMANFPENNMSRKRVLRTRKGRKYLVSVKILFSPQINI